MELCESSRVFEVNMDVSLSNMYSNDSNDVDSSSEFERHLSETLSNHDVLQLSKYAFDTPESHIRCRLQPVRDLVSCLSNNGRVHGTEQIRLDRVPQKVIQICWIDVETTPQD